MLRPLTTGEVLDRTFQIYRKNFVLFVTISAIPNCVMLLISLGVLTSKQAADPLLAGLWGLTSAVLSLIFGAIVTAATTFGVSDVYLGRPTSISDCFRRVRGRVLTLIATSILFGIMVVVGLIFLLVPGIYLLGRYGLSSPAVVLEDLSASDALNRSSKLAKGAVGRVLLLFILMYSLLFALAVGIGAVIGLWHSAAQHGAMTVKAVNEIGTTMAGILAGPVLAIGLTVLYYDQRVRKEAFDIENMMSLLGEPSAPGTAEGATAGF